MIFVGSFWKSRTLYRWAASSLAAVVVMSIAITMPASAQTTPNVLLLDANALLQARADPSLRPQIDELRQRADAALRRGPFTVSAKQVPPPSGELHDYVSLSIYWWPDPATVNGLPYIQRDGVRNTEADDATRYDANPLNKMVRDVETLSLTYYLTADARYAQYAAAQLRTWFLDPDTRMNPNFRFAQIIPGRDAIRGTGIIESRLFTRIVDGVALLQDCTCWTPADQAGLRVWFKQFETWLRTSPNGQLEAKTTNNHAVWYDVQLADFALFAGDVEAARQVLTAAPARRIDTQIAGDGSMPRELERTRSLHYSNFNLQAFAELAVLARRVDVDLWSYTTPEGASLRTALDFLTPYMTATDTWPYDEITDINSFHESGQTLARAAAAYPDGGYADLLNELSAGQSPADLLRLQLGYWPD